MTRDRRDRAAGTGSSVSSYSRLAAITALLGALVVILSQLVTAYSLDDPYGLTITNITLLDKHGAMPLILAVIAVGLLVWTILSGNRTGALLIAAIGLTIIFIFLIVDLPDIGDTGMYNAPGAGNLDATGKASTGLWLELVGGTVLALAGLALATLDSAQLKAIGPGREPGALN